MEMKDLLVWKALSDPTRRELLDLLKERPQTTGELCAAFEKLSRFAVMKHLRVLEAVKLVVVRRDGRQRWNHLNAVPLRQIYERWVSKYESEWAGALLKLKRVTESKPSERKEFSMEKFHIEQEVQIDATPNRVFEALTKDVAAWWGAPYQISETAKTIILEPKLGGRFYEDWGSGQGALWATVTQLKQNEILELTGPIGMSGAVQGIACIALEAKGKATLVKLSHRAVGEVNEQKQKGYSAGWQDLLGKRLKEFVEKGIRSGIAR